MSSVHSHVAGKLIKRAIAARKEGKLGSRPWTVEVTFHNLGGMATDMYKKICLYHYGTKMLVAHVDYSGHAAIKETWTGWGSVSDQSGMNAALWALGSNMRYSRDTKGGGPRVNPFRVASMIRGGLTSASPAVYNPGMVFPPRLSYNARRRKRR